MDPCGGDTLHLCIMSTDTMYQLYLLCLRLLVNPLGFLVAGSGRPLCSPQSVIVLHVKDIIIAGVSHMPGIIRRIRRYKYLEDGMIF